MEIQNSFLSPKGENVDMGLWYAFLMLEEKNLNFVSRNKEGVGAAAGLGTVGGGAAATTSYQKRDAFEAALTQIDLLTRRLSNNSDRLTSMTEKAMVRLFSPSPTFTDVSTSVNNDTASYIAAKEKKVDSERKLLFLKEQIEYQKCVLLSEYFNPEEKTNSKAELADLLLQLKEHTK
jgi:hypothetical protein